MCARRKRKGAKFIVSTDAHHPKHLLNMRYGILTARRGGLAAEDIVNTYPAEQFVRIVAYSPKVDLCENPQYYRSRFWR